jgi:uncharacterized protein
MYSWTHAAAFLPMADFRFSLPYKHAIKGGQTHWHKVRDEKLMGELLARIRSEGPLRSRDVETNPTKRSGWWDWKPAKKALEQMYMQGDLMVSDRTGFQKTYDLTERVVPSHINSQMPSMEEFAAHLIDQQLRCHGLISLSGVTYQRRNAELSKAVKALVSERLAQRSLEQVATLFRTSTSEQWRNISLGNGCARTPPSQAEQPPIDSFAVRQQCDSAPTAQSTVSIRLSACPVRQLPSCW